MKKLGILGAAAALLMFAASSQAITLGVSYTVHGSYAGYTGYLGGSTFFPDYDWGTTWSVSETEPSSEWLVYAPWFTPLDTVSVDFTFYLGEKETVSNPLYTYDYWSWSSLGEGTATGHGPWNDLTTSAWTWDDPLTFDLGDNRSLKVSLQWDDCSFFGFDRTCLFAGLVDPVTGDNGASDATAVPAPGVLTLFGLAVGLLGGVVVVRRRNA